jgi:hypothetical protein
MTNNNEDSSSSRSSINHKYADDVYDGLRRNNRAVTTVGNGNFPPPPPLRNFSSSGRNIFSTNSGAFTPSDQNKSYASNYYSSANLSRVRLHDSRGGYNNNVNLGSNDAKGGGGGSLGGAVAATTSYRRNSMSLAESSPGSLNLGQSPTPTATRTSLTDFKKLLQTVQRSKHSVSAMEILKPKVIGLETTL